MINLDYLIKNKKKLREKYLTALPFPHLVIDNFCDNKKLDVIFDNIPDLENKSADSIFASNKFEKSAYYSIHPYFKEYYEQIKSSKMNDFLSYISCRDIFVDPKNHGGGLHVGKGKSSLDMHLDYNYHPINKFWWREMNVLFYLTKNWKPEYGGHLELEDLRTGTRKKLDIGYNKLIIQECSNYSLHGYRRTNFPDNMSRISIATYAFSKHVNHLEKPRTTDWFPNRHGKSNFTHFLGRNIHKIVNIKNKIFNSSTSKNQ